MDTIKDYDKKGKFPEALQGAFILVFGYQATILSKPISTLSSGIFNWFHILIIFVILINLFNIIF